MAQPYESIKPPIAQTEKSVVEEEEEEDINQRLKLEAGT